ncbi:hypothetical protein Tco_0378546, partial [Tanacetum coccineum]
NYFVKGTIDPTLFIRLFDDDILVVQPLQNVDDGGMTFFLGLQVNQSPCDILINQSNYVLEILKKYGMETCDPVGIPMELKDKLDLDQNGSLVVATKYRSMIGALMYLTSSRPDILHATCLCARYQAKPTEKHLNEVKRVFHYLWGTVNMGLWYTKDFGFELTGFSDADYAGCKDTFKSTSGEAQRQAPLEYQRETCDPVGTPMELKDKLDLDQNGSPVDATKYHSMIGALMYLTSRRPDILHATYLCARYQAKTTEKHLKEDSGFELTGFSDADYAGCKDTFKSTSGGAQFLGEKLLTDYGYHFNKISIYYDSKSAIAIPCNPIQQSRTKHIVVRYHFIKEQVEKGTIELYFVKTDYQLADLFTKALLVDRFTYLVCRLGMCSLSPQELERLAKSQ